MTAFSAETFSKWVAAVAAVSYGIGFIATNSALARFGITEPTFLAPKYLSSGLSYLMITILTGIGWIAVALLYESRLREATTSPDRRLSLQSLFGLLLISFAISIIIGMGLKTLIINDVSTNWKMHLLWMSLNFVGCVSLTLGVIQRSVRGAGGIVWPILGLVLIIYAADLFGREVYRLIPGQFGGFEMRTAQIIIKKEIRPVLAAVGITTYRIPPTEFAVSRSVVLVGTDSSNAIFCTSNCLGYDPGIIVLNRDHVVGIAE